MQIHELPTGIPTIDDYAAIDNGSATRKVQIKNFDIGLNPVNFDSYDKNTAQATSWQDAQKITSGLSLKTILMRASCLLCNVRYLYNYIGDTVLATTASTISGAINELKNKIGTDAMHTSASTLTGAIGELATFCDDLPDFENTYQTPITDWERPSVYDDNCTLVSGGYIEEGKHTYVQMKINLNDGLAASSNLQVFKEMPEPTACNAVLNVQLGTRPGGGYIDTDGKLYIRTSADAAATTSTNIYITGHYITA